MDAKNYTALEFGAFVGSFDLTVKMEVAPGEWGDVTIKGMKLFKKNSNQWTAFPSECVEKDGEKKYFPRMFFDDPEMKKKFTTTSVSAVKDMPPSEREKSPQDTELEGLPF